MVETDLTHEVVVIDLEEVAWKVLIEVMPEYDVLKMVGDVVAEEVAVEMVAELKVAVDEEVVVVGLVAANEVIVEVVSEFEVAIDDGNVLKVVVLQEVVVEESVVEV